MRRILKFPLVPGVTVIETADEPRCLAVGVQGPQVILWVEATVGAGVETLIASVMTGEEAPADGTYIGTTQLGGIVVHAYRGPR